MWPNISLELWLEPCDDFVRVAPATSLRVEAAAPEPGELEVEWGEDGATVYAWRLRRCMSSMQAVPSASPAP